jgi:hypothetical protein
MTDYRPEPGPVLSGTLRTEDLMCATLRELERHNPYDSLAVEANAVAALHAAGWTLNGDTIYESEQSHDLLNAMLDRVNELTTIATVAVRIQGVDQPYLYFGLHPDDGALLGYWLTSDNPEG